MELDDFIKRLENTEKDVDRILKAARLDRHERQPMSKDKLEMILGTILGALGMILIFGFFFTLFYLCR